MTKRPRRLLVALSRYGGLRCPSECLRLRWLDIDSATERITITSPKTEHHNGKGTRVIPLFSELRPDQAGRSHFTTCGRVVKPNWRPISRCTLCVNGSATASRSRCGTISRSQRSTSRKRRKKRCSNLLYRLAPSRSRDQPRMKKALFCRALRASARMCDALGWALQDLNL